MVFPFAHSYTADGRGRPSLPLEHVIPRGCSVGMGLRTVRKPLKDPKGKWLGRGLVHLFSTGCKHQEHQPVSAVLRSRSSPN